ncbi:MAG: FtsB family cell division protein [Halanaerobiales bacterium]
MLQRAQKKTRKYNNDYGTRTSEKCKQKKRKKYLILYITFILVMGCFMVVHISQSISINNLSYRIEEMEEKYDGINEENEILELKLSKNNSLSRVERLARSELNMGEPEQIAYIEVDEGEEKIQKPGSEDGEETFFVFRIFDEVVNSFNTVRAFGG